MRISWVGDLVTISSRVFSLLAEQNITQKDFADALGVATSTVQAWKKRPSDPPADLICTIAHFLGVSISYILTGEDEPINVTEKTSNIPMSDEAIRLAIVWDQLNDADQKIIEKLAFEKYKVLLNEKKQNKAKIS